MGQSLLTALISGMLIINLIGCGGGADDPTAVALRPNKEPAQGGGSGNGSSSTNPGTPGTGTPSAPVEGFGGITGRIVIAEADKGSVPPPTITLFAVGKATVDTGFCAKETPILNETLIVNPMSLGIKNAFFYLEAKPKGGKATIESQKAWPTADESGAKLVLDQRNCTYTPHAMILIANQKFLAQSQDAVLHSYKGSPSRSSAFNLTIPPKGSTEVNVYTRPEKNPVAISCATHNWMSGYQLPLDHPYGAVTNENGQFTISDLPSGTHTFAIWHEKGGKIRDYDVEVKANETVDIGAIALRMSQLNK